MNYQIRYNNFELKNDFKESLIYLYNDKKYDIDIIFKNLHYGDYIIINDDEIYYKTFSQNIETFNLYDFIYAVKLLRKKHKHTILKINNIEEYYKIINYFENENYIINVNMFNSEPYIMFLNIIIIDNQINFIIDDFYHLLFSENTRINFNQYLRINKLKKIL